MEVFRQKHLGIWLGIPIRFCSAQKKNGLNTVQINITKIPLLGKHPNLAILARIVLMNVCFED